jgi:MoaA/NifB/PqqE/SkfB family radical SAM enzyme
MKIRLGGSRPVVQNPWSIQLEVVEGCNYSCWFCGIHSVRSKDTPEVGWNDFREMPVEMVKEMFKETRRWLNGVRVELDNHGEPTLHKNFPGIIKAITLDPKAHIQLQTNGSQIEDWKVFKELVDEWFAAGLNLLAINAYKRWWGKPQDFKSRYEMFMAYAKRYAKLHPEIDRVVDHYYDNPEHLSIYRRYNMKMKQIFVLDDLGEVNVKKRQETGRPVSKDINNEAGNTMAKPLQNLLGQAPITEPLVKKCTRPFRELNMGYNGVVPVCCYDWSTQIPVGKFPNQSLQAIWESVQLNAIRQLLYHKNRNMTPCSVCSYAGGWRQGLLKDPKMKETDEELQAMVASHLRSMKEYVFQGNGANLKAAPLQVAGQVIPLASLKAKRG